MGILSRQRVARVAALACGLLSFQTASAFDAAVPLQLGPQLRAVASSEPFGLIAIPVSAGSVHDKWSMLKGKLDDERVQLALCDGDRDGCASDAALQFLAIVDTGRAREGRARLGEINRAINLAIRAASDLAEYGEIDVWSSPLATFAHGAGDCEDYAIAKFVALRQAGVPAEDLRIIIMRDISHGEDHAVAAARLDGHWLMLDNRHMAMVEDAYVRNYRPLFAIGETGLSRYVDQPLEARATGRNIAPSPAVNPIAQPSLITASN
ncbi:transglutaminase-like cysteine peptidase [Bradyrhizobium sp. Tv2a-2]|uniref:transglutaminase-like cysteine peptidase n=1 Tax=Bradyrhizobium sp. Tv2a-2 TaxID=113395 RepID=UPI000416C9A4|nr:transglutaminase-like cysteine peptidase [Bradyrhizobium sp. Tv2a-2]